MSHVRFIDGVADVHQFANIRSRARSVCDSLPSSAVDERAHLTVARQLDGVDGHEADSGCVQTLRCETRCIGSRGTSIKQHHSDYFERLVAHNEIKAPLRECAHLL